MSTIRDFRDAPIGATATLPGCPTVVKVKNLPTDKGNWSDGVVAWKAEDLVACGYQLDKLPSRPTTAREALDLAWELAHPVKIRQVLPEGTACLYRLDDGYQIHKTPEGMIARESWTDIRTLDPLPDPEPDWLDARAVLAAMDECSWQKVWFSKFDGYWECTCCGDRRHWTELTDVTQLYPKENEK